MSFILKYLLYSILIGLLVSCSSAPPKKKSLQSSFRFKRLEILPNIFDDLDFKNLNKVLSIHLNYWKKRPQKRLKWGSDFSISGLDYFKGLQKLSQFLKTRPSSEKFKKYVRENFEFIGVQSDKKPLGWTYVTSYFEPVIPASKKRDDRFSQPLYEIPKNLVNIEMGEFAKKFPRWSLAAKSKTEQKSQTAVLRGRLVESQNSTPSRILPFYERSEIDGQGKLSGQAKIIAFVDPVESFFLQIQGSGVLRFKNGNILRVGYGAQNGHPYRAIGKDMFQVIPRSKMSLQTIESFLNRLPADERDQFLFANKSYVFFQKLTSRGITFAGTPVVDGRTIATDYRIFPKGTLAWMSLERPKTENSQALNIGRFVFDQDTGGAIRGPQRVDLFWGQGDTAKEMAGDVKDPAKIFYLIPKTSAKSLP